MPFKLEELDTDEIARALRRGAHILIGRTADDEYMWDEVVTDGCFSEAVSIMLYPTDRRKWTAETVVDAIRDKYAQLDALVEASVRYGG